MQLHESAENYLETILVLEKRIGAVRSIDIANEMTFSKPSVSRAVNLLKEDAYITIDKQGYIALTQKGRCAAERVYERHELLTSLFIALGVDKQTAEEDACHIEHDLSDVTFEKLRPYLYRILEEKKNS